MSALRRTAPIALAAALLLAAANGADAAVTSSISQDRVAEGDSFVLTLETDDASGAAPDLSPLQQDFEVGGTSQSSSTQVINGHVSRTAGWSITLTPKSIGTLTIPAIKVGTEASRPLEIEVVDAASVPPATLDKNGLEVTMSVEPGTYYVQQEIPVAVRIVASADISGATLTEPSAPGALVTRTGEDQTSRSTRNGKPVSVTERTYLVKPQESGELRIAPATLRAVVPDAKGGRRSPFGGRDPFERMRQQFGMPSLGSFGFGSSLFDTMMNPGHEIVARARPVTLDIMPRPFGASGWFLPAKNVELKATWKPEDPSFRQGEAVQRVIQIIALGASKEQLPDLAFDDVDGAQVYVERVDDRSADTGKGTAAIKQYTVSVVPTRGGEVTLPAVSVNWLASATGEEKTAVLDAETIAVTGDAQPSAAGAPAPSRTVAGRNASHAGPWVSGREPLLYGASAVLLMMLLAVAIWGVRQRRPASGGPSRSTSAAESPANKARARNLSRPDTTRANGEAVAAAAASVRKACRRNDAVAAFTALAAWRLAVAESSQPLSAAAAARLDDALRGLEHQLYGTGPTSGWSGHALLDAFDAVCAARDGHVRPPRKVGNLPPLYAGAGRPRVAA